jgi:histidinol-phosphatase (PHP family)
VHFIVPPNGAEPFCVDGSSEELQRGIREGFGGDGEALMHAYWDAVLEMIALGGFNILGHVDLLKKNNGGSRFFESDSGPYRERCAEIAAAAGAAAGAAAEKSGLVVEVNTGGINRGRIDEPYPSFSLLRLLFQAGVPAIITADAHCAAHLDGNYDAAFRLLTKAGYSGNLAVPPFLL